MRLHCLSEPPNRPSLVRLTFDPAVSMNEVAATLELSLLAAESLHGADRLRLESSWSIDWQKRQVQIDVSASAGRTLAIVFLGYVRREFGVSAVLVNRSVHFPASDQAEVGT